MAFDLEFAKDLYEQQRERKNLPPEKLEELHNNEMKMIKERWQKEIDAEKERQKKNKEEAGKWIKAGEISIDAGLCWIGDPCYIIGRCLPHANHTTGFKSLDEPKGLPRDVGKSWFEFGDKISERKEENIYGSRNKTYAQFYHDAGHTGLGIVTETGYGGGQYDVFVKKNSEGRVAEVKIVFIQEDEE